MEQSPALTDFPKLYCPFLRQTFEVNVAQWKTLGAKIGLREPRAYLVVDRIAPGYEWVFEDHRITVDLVHGSSLL